jgi:tRNA (Thr-GGU) A37 N-methylase
MDQIRFELVPVGWVESPLTDPASAPKQGHEGSPEAWLVFEPWVLQGLDGIRADVANPEQGVFNTRSQDRPNPIGLHPVEVVSIEGNRLRVRNLEALDATPILDVKPVLGPAS